MVKKHAIIIITQNDIKELWDFIARFENSFFDIVKTVPRFYYKSIDHWFCADAITVLSVIKSEISKLGKNEQKIFCNLVFSSIINTVSNQESDTRYAAIIKPNLNIQNIFDVFVKKFKTILSLFEIYNEKFIMKSNCEVLLSDSQYCNQILKLNSVDLILTSPPYPNTYDFDKTVVRYNIAIIDTALINKFSPLINENGKLAGELSYPEIYVIQ